MVLGRINYGWKIGSSFLQVCAGQRYWVGSHVLSCTDSQIHSWFLLMHLPPKAQNKHCDTKEAASKEATLLKLSINISRLTNSFNREANVERPHSGQRLETKITSGHQCI